MKEKMVTFESNVNGLKDQGKKILQNKAMDFNFQPQKNNLSWNNLPVKKEHKGWCKCIMYLCEATGE